MFLVSCPSPQGAPLHAMASVFAAAIGDGAGPATCDPYMLALGGTPDAEAGNEAPVVDDPYMSAYMLALGGMPDDADGNEEPVVDDPYMSADPPRPLVITPLAPMARHSTCRPRGCLCVRVMIRECDYDAPHGSHPRPHPIHPVVP